MHEDDNDFTASLELMVFADQQALQGDRDVQEKAERARELADAARFALAELAYPAVQVISMRLFGAPAEGGQGALKAGEFPIDSNGRPVTKERENTAWEVLSRMGVPKLRATAIAAAWASHTQAPAPGAPGWEPAEGEDGDVKELDPASVDAQIESFLAGAKAARDLRGDQ